MNTVLIADDHAFFRAGLETALTGAGYDVVASVEDGRHAVECADRLTPDFIILDVRMPRLDGSETLKELRETGFTGPIVMLAAEFEDDVLASCIRGGADAIVSKEGAQDKLFEALAAIGKGGKFIDGDFLERFASSVAQDAVGKPPAGSSYELKDRERNIAERVGRGMRNRDIAEELGMSEAMVKLTLHRMYSRLGIANRTELALFMREETARKQ